MGTGRFKNGKFDLVVVANFVMSATDVTEWRRSFEKASELFWDASEGQVQYGRIFLCDESVGADSAEIILHASGDPSYGTWGKFGVPGQALHAGTTNSPGSRYVPSLQHQAEPGRASASTTTSQTAATPATTRASTSRPRTGATGPSSRSSGRRTRRSPIRSAE